MTLKNRVRICFLGAGSIGSLFGGYLALNIPKNDNVEIIFICRSSHCKVVNETGLSIHSEGDLIKVSGIKAYDNLHSLLNYLNDKKEFNFDFLVISTKTRDLENALNEYELVIQRSSFVVILQNGIGNEELVAKYVEKTKILRIVTSHGAFFKKPGQIIHTGKGFVKIGFPYKKDNNSKELEFLSSFLTSSGLKTEIVNDINLLSWEKAFVNIGINAIGALTRLNNGEIIKNNDLLSLMSSLIKESVIVARRSGIKIPEKDYFKLARKIAYETKDNFNSMLQDIISHKPTEIDFLNGRIVNLAKSRNIDVPMNRTVTMLIKALEKSSV